MCLASLNVLPIRVEGSLVIFSILIQVVDDCLLRITMRMSVTPQDSEPIRLSNEDERVDQSSVSNNGKVSLPFCGAARGIRILSYLWAKGMRQATAVNNLTVTTVRGMAKGSILF